MHSQGLSVEWLRPIPSRRQQPSGGLTAAPISSAATPAATASGATAALASRFVHGSSRTSLLFGPHQRDCQRPSWLISPLAALEPSYASSSHHTFLSMPTTHCWSKWRELEAQGAGSAREWQRGMEPSAELVLGPGNHCLQTAESAACCWKAQARRTRKKRGCFEAIPACVPAAGRAS